MSQRDDQNERERRMQALRSLAHEQPPQEPASVSSGAGEAHDGDALHGQSSSLATFKDLRHARLIQAPPARRSRWLRVAAGVIVVALLASLGVALVRDHLSHAAGHASAPAVLAITPLPDGVACPAGAAWSPNGGLIAVVGYQTQCPDSDLQLVNEPGKLIIYETGKGHIVANVTLSLDTLAEKIGVSLPTQLPPPSTSPEPTLLYDAPIWSPDGQHIEIPFVVRPACFCEQDNSFQFGETGAPTRVGLLELSASGQLEAALSAPYSASQQTVEWDLERKTLAPDVGQLAVAQTYHWSGARLSPASPLGAKAQPGPIGDPQRATSFSLWQTGWAGSVLISSGETPTPNGNSESIITQVPGALLLKPTFAAWSPDGRYLLLPTFNPLLLIPGGHAPDHTMVQQAGLAQAQQVVPRDAALASLFSTFAHAGSDEWFTPDALAWSPDGKLLAVALDIPSDTRPQDQSVTLLDTHTGKTVAMLIPEASTADALEVNPMMQSQAPLSASPQLAWSSDGSRLFLLNQTLGTITIWKVKS